MKKQFAILFISWMALLTGSLCAAEKPKLELLDEDRIAFIGGGFMEREQDEGYIETMLTLSFPHKNLSFRNLGWSGDTVETHLHPMVPARPAYVPNLFEYVNRLKPTVIFVSYGMMESFRDWNGVADFDRNFRELLDKLSKTTKRIVIVSPFKHEKLSGDFPDPTEHNEKLKLCVEAMGNIAKERNLVFINLFENLPVAPAAPEPMTINGVHLNTRGYETVARVMQKELGLTKAFDLTKNSARAEKLRAAIKHKNRQWWYHYRPMNSEYVYPGGTRYQDELGGVKHPMYEEIQLFADMAEVEEQGIHLLREKVLSDGKTRHSGKELNKAESASAPAPMVRTPDPELERKTFQVADGMEVNLFAADPLINKPVQMSFDARGRLWVATTTLYPQIKPGEEPTDKIIILEDTNHDGRADKTTVFADGFYLPTGVLPTSDGAYVSEDTKIYYLRDRDGDGKADEREVVLAGFGTEDSHHKAHVLRWDPHGAINFNTGVFLHNNIETPYGVTSQSGHWNAGIFAYRPDIGRLDIHLANSVPPNPWGHYWNYWGFDFLIDSSGQMGSNFILPTANRTSSAISVPGGNGKLAGGELISGRHFPKEWQGNLVAAPFKENRLGRWEFSDDSSGYAEKAMNSVIVSTDSAFRPVDHRMGPDGALYVADWYNPLIGHMQHHFRDPGRDFTHGRIWRITAKGRPLVPSAKIADASIRQLLENLKAPEANTRLNSRRELTTRNREQVEKALQAWVKNLNPQDTNYDHYRVEALWAYENVNVVEPALLKSVLTAKEPNARAAAVVVLCNWREHIDDAIPLLEKCVADEYPRVRLQAVIALSYFTDKRAMEIATRVLDYPMDTYLDQALKNTAVALKSVWEPTLSSEEGIFHDGKKLEFVLQAAGTQANPKSLVSLFHLNRISPENFDKAVNTVVENGDKSDLAALFRMDFNNEQQVKVLNGLAKAARERGILTTVNSESGKRLEGWLDDKDERVRAATMRLIGAWKGEMFRTRLLTAAQDESAPVRIRVAAIDGLGTMEAGPRKIGGERSETWKVLYKLRVPKVVKMIRDAAISALADVDLVNGADRVVRILCLEPETVEEVAKLLNLILTKKEGGSQMASIIDVSVLPPAAFPKIMPDNAKLALRAMQLSGRNSPVDQQLIEQFGHFAGIDAEAKELTHDELQKLAQEVKAKGDPARGERIFRRQEMMCSQCHAIGGAGGILGPELGAVGSGSQVDYLIESILNPSKIIKDGFETWEITTKDDESTIGIKVREAAQEMVLKDAARNEIVIPQSSIKSKASKKTSLMPAGLTAALTQGELLDLVRFLSELGKPGAYANNPNPIVRRWQVTSAAAKKVEKADSIAWADTLAWTPAYSMVSGSLPLDALGRDAKASEDVALARCQVEVTTPGKILFRVNSLDGLANAWVDGKAIELRPTTAVELPRGVHTLCLAVDASKRKDGLMVEFEEAENSPGRFQLVTGR